MPAAGPGAGSAAAPPPARLCLLALALPLALPGRGAAAEPARTVYTNHWAVRVRGGPAEAARLAAAYGYISLGQVRGGGAGGLRERAGAGAPGAGDAGPGGRTGDCRAFWHRELAGDRGAAGGLTPGVPQPERSQRFREDTEGPGIGKAERSRQTAGDSGTGSLRQIPGVGSSAPESCSGCRTGTPGTGKPTMVPGPGRRRGSRRTACTPGTGARSQEREMDSEISPLAEVSPSCPVSEAMPRVPGAGDEPSERSG